MRRIFYQESHIEAPVAYLVSGDERPCTFVYPKSSGRETIRPEQIFHNVKIFNCRELGETLTLDGIGFELHQHNSAILNFYDEREVRESYYREISAFLKDLLDARDVIVFDSNTRSSVRSRSGQHGVREPVEGAHVDYTPASGPRRSGEILESAGKKNLSSHKMALVNVWRPIVGPVEDVPLTVCDARSTEPRDYVESDIYHFGENDLDKPRHRGQVYSLRYNPKHLWYFAPHMRPDEILLLKGWDSAGGHDCFTPHTGFQNPAPPANYQPRESIEVRTLVIY